MTDWYPIATCPKDRPVLLGRRVLAEKWTPHGHPFQVASGFWADGYAYSALPGWWDLTDVPQGAMDHEVGFEPTHWAEIEAPPEAGELPPVGADLFPPFGDAREAVATLLGHWSPAEAERWLVARISDFGGSPLTVRFLGRQLEVLLDGHGLPTSAPPEVEP